MSKRELSAVAKALIDARAKIQDPKQHCKQAFCLFDAEGVPVSHCALGALGFSFLAEDVTVIPGDRSSRRAAELLSRSCTELFGEDVVSVNDFRGHPAIMKAFDHAIQQELNKMKGNYNGSE